MFDRHRKRAAVLFATADVVLLILAFELAYQLRVYVPLPLEFYIVTPTKVLVLGFTLACWLGTGWWFGVYNRLYMNQSRIAVLDTFRQLAFTTLGLVSFLFALKLDISRVFIGFFAFLSLVLLVFYHVSAGPLRGWIRRQFGDEAFYVIVGSGEKAIEIGRQLEQAREYRVRLTAFVDPTGALGESVRLEETYPVRKSGDVPAMLRADVIDEMIFAVEPETLGDLEELFFVCAEEGVRTHVVVDFFPHVHGEVYFEHFGAVPLLTFSATPSDELRLLIKRAFDVVVALLALVILAVPMLILSILVRATSKGSAIFSQVRCGLNGRKFVFYKFCSMVENAEELKPQLEHMNERDGPIFKISQDPRLTSLGRHLRRYSIDEWPQFWNVLKGDMSFVGPRPAVPSEVEQYEMRQRRRLRMRPGLTCLWAIRGRDNVDFENWMRMDLEYIDNWSLWLDFKILAASVVEVLSGKGAH